MNVNDTKNVLRIMAAAYSHVLTEDEVILWANMFSADDPDVCMGAAKEYVKTERFWPTPADFRKHIRATKTAAIRAGQANTELDDRALGAVKCEGYGWVPFGGTDMPCTSCNPALAEIWYDEKKMKLHRDGWPIHDILGITKEDLRDRYGDRPRCIPSHYDDETISVKRGREVARMAYVTDCASRGVEPNMEHFDGIMGGTS